MSIPDDEQPLVDASENALTIRRPVGEWTDAQLVNARRHLERLAANLAEALERIAAEQDKRLAVYADVVDVVGLGEGGR